MGACTSRGRARRATFEFDDSAKPHEVVETLAQKVKSASNEGELKQVNGYRIGHVLGTGSYGTVYEGTGRDGLKVAIKVIEGSVTRRAKLLCPGDPAELAEKREIAVMKNLTHPHCVQLFEVIDDPVHNRTFLVMELLQGGTVLERENLPAGMTHLPEACARVVFRELLQGLQYLHCNGVMHRDIKPDNIGHSQRPPWGRSATSSRRRFANATRDLALSRSLSASMQLAPSDLAEETATKTLEAQQETVDEAHRWSRSSSRLASPVWVRSSSRFLDSSRSPPPRRWSRSALPSEAPSPAASPLPLDGGAASPLVEYSGSVGQPEQRSHSPLTERSRSPPLQRRMREPAATGDGAGPSTQPPTSASRVQGWAVETRLTPLMPSFGSSKSGGAPCEAAPRPNESPPLPACLCGRESTRSEEEDRIEAERLSYAHRPELMANVKLLDFGISVLSSANGTALSHGEHSADDWLEKATGTPAFYAPEMCTKGGYLGRPADIWAAGVTLCMLTGANPFVAPHMPAMFDRIRHSEPDLPPDASPGLRHVLTRMLAKDVGSRATMEELFRDPWVTDGGRFPMPTNFCAVSVDDDDIAGAVGERLGVTLTVLKAKSLLLGSHEGAQDAARTTEDELTSSSRDSDAPVGGDTDECDAEEEKEEPAERM